eukprot:355528-Chlamydomonas_euryale.AAC.11
MAGSNLTPVAARRIQSELREWSTSPVRSSHDAKSFWGWRVAYARASGARPHCQRMHMLLGHGHTANVCAKEGMLRMHAAKVKYMLQKASCNRQAAKGTSQQATCGVHAENRHAAEGCTALHGRWHGMAAHRV